MPVNNYESKIHLLLSDARGQYIPRDFAKYFDSELWHYKKEDQDILIEGPEVEWYWDTWVSVEAQAYYMVESYSAIHESMIVGKWTLYQNGDLWAIHESMTEADWEEWNPM